MLVSIQETKKARSPSPSRTLSRFFRFAKLPGFRRRSRAIKPNVSEKVPRNKNRPLSPTKQPARINVPAGVLLNCGEDHEQLILKNGCLTSALKLSIVGRIGLSTPRPDFFSHLPPVFLRTQETKSARIRTQKQHTHRTIIAMESLLFLSEDHEHLLGMSWVVCQYSNQPEILVNTLNHFFFGSASVAFPESDCQLAM